MDEARAVLTRLDRIEALERERAHPAAILAELRELVHEAEAWARREGDTRAEAAVSAIQERAFALQ
ncbi:MAG: hypothetical protein ACRDL2_02025 [Gaiellaceae bacterium]